MYRHRRSLARKNLKLWTENDLKKLHFPVQVYPGKHVSTLLTMIQLISTFFEMNALITSHPGFVAVLHGPLVVLSYHPIPSLPRSGSCPMISSQVSETVPLALTGTILIWRGGTNFKKVSSDSAPISSPANYCTKVSIFPVNCNKGGIVNLSYVSSFSFWIWPIQSKNGRNFGKKRLRIVDNQ